MTIWSWQRRLAPYLFVFPFVAIFICFFLWPLCQSVVMSLRVYAGPRVFRSVGVRNYVYILSDRLFWLAVLNTAVFAILFLSLELPLALGLAFALNSPRVQGRSFFRFAFFSPYLVGPVFASVIFLLLLDSRRGLITRAILAVLPISAGEIPWRTSPFLAMPAVVLAALWLATGQAIVYLLAALQAVDHQLYEAAEVDGAGGWARFRHVTLPSIRPVLAYLALVGTIYSLQLYELPYLFFQGVGPGGAGLTLVGYLYLQGFVVGNLGYASAVGWVLVVVFSLVAWVQSRVTIGGRGT